MITAAIITTTNVVKVGFTFKNSPNAIPAKEIWAKVSAINDCLLRTKKRPKIGAITAIKNAAWNARCMNP